MDILKMSNAVLNNYNNKLWKNVLPRTMFSLSSQLQISIMKNRSLLISILTILGAYTDLINLQAHASATILKCKGKIPINTACLIEPSSYKLDTYRVDICKNNPFPDYRSSADYKGAGCITLFNGNGDLYKWELKKNSKYSPPQTGRNKISPGSYRYLTMVFKNSFTTSGKYTSGEKTWRTTGNNKKNIATTKGDPSEFTVKLKNWRGKNNLGNDYCDNDGGTFSRCEMNYNGYNLTGVGLGSNFIENYGSTVTYMFYMVELLSPIKLKGNLEGYFDIKVKNRLEVYGNGASVTSISNAPFIFEATYID